MVIRIYEEHFVFNVRDFTICFRHSWLGAIDSMCIIGRNQGRGQAIDGAARGMRYEIMDIDMGMGMGMDMNKRRRGVREYMDRNIQEKAK